MKTHSKIGILFRKEITDILRDKKAVAMMILVPVLLYPLIFIVSMQVMITVQNSMETAKYRIATSCSQEDPFYERLMEVEADSKKRNSQSPVSDSSSQEDATSGKDGQKGTTVSEPDSSDVGISSDDGDKMDAEKKYVLSVRGVKQDYDYKKALNNGKIDAYVAGENGSYKVYYIVSEDNSKYANGLVTDLLDELNNETVKNKVEAEGLDPDSFLRPIHYEVLDVATGEQSIGAILGGIIPFLFVTSLIMGTMYPAIDTTAGEKERGTLETLLVLPITSREMLTAKFIAVSLMGVVSALLNILSMAGIAYYMYHMSDMFGQAPDIHLAAFGPVILICILAVVAFAFFVSAVSMCFTAFAKSFKEANNYITPFMLVVMLCGYIGFIPNVKLTPTMAAVPVAGITLMIKNILLFKIDAGVVAIVLITNVAYALLAMLFLGRIYDSESVLFDAENKSIRLFERRENIAKGGVPGTGDAILALALVMVSAVYLGGLVSGMNITANILCTQASILLIPLAIVLYEKDDLRKTYAFRKAGLRDFAGALLLGIGVWLLNIPVNTLMGHFFASSLENRLATYEQMWKVGPALSLLFTALLPAVCEEMLFRGFTLGAFRKKYGMMVSSILVGVLFGLYHMNMSSFVGLTLLGTSLCIMVWYSGSIYPAMLVHFLNNASAWAATEYPDRLGRPVAALDGLMKSSGGIVVLILAGLILSAAGIAIVRRNKPKTN